MIHKYKAWDGTTMYQVYTLPLINPNDLVTVITPDNTLSVLQKPIILQFTGLTDKKGVEIYDKCIIKAWHANCEGYILGVVRYCDEMACYLLQWKNECFKCDMPLWEFEEFEVIGNIYSNPELLED